jgi:hypothetical protein
MGRNSILRLFGNSYVLCFINKITPMNLRFSLLFLSVLFVFCACKNNGREKTRFDGLGFGPINKSAAGSIKGNDGNWVPKWINAVVLDYIEKSNSKLIRAARAENISETWMFDHVLSTDTAKYVIVQIGHDVVESDRADPRYVTDEWIYIDTISRKLYEYDLPIDSLIFWNTD